MAMENVDQSIEEFIEQENCVLVVLLGLKTKKDQSEEISIAFIPQSEKLEIAEEIISTLIGKLGDIKKIPNLRGYKPHWRFFTQSGKASRSTTIIPTIQEILNTYRPPHGHFDNMRPVLF